MATGEVVVAITCGKPSRGKFRFKIGVDPSAGVAQGASDDLDNAATAEIDARTKHGVKFRESGVGEKEKPACKKGVSSSQMPVFCGRTLGSWLPARTSSGYRAPCPGGATGESQ
jgi:hypothetical protein